MIEEAAKLEEERRKEMKAVKQEYDEDGNPIKKRKVEKVKEKKGQRMMKAMTIMTGYVASVECSSIQPVMPCFFVMGHV